MGHRPLQVIKYISAVNIRVAHEIKGVARKIITYVGTGNQIKNTLIVSPPGAGKTTFVRALGKSWHIDTVKSPSFSILDVHRGDRTLIHIDAYRLKPDIKNPFDWDDLCVPPFCIVVEWPECLNFPIGFDAHITLEILPENYRRIRVVFS